ncbi:MAG: 2-oxoacid:acceptor oxidoreductase subunit alpha [bacterium]|nr:2-oxoacid:acceptor oxidoreductase subunit alpha [bacterium]
MSKSPPIREHILEILSDAGEGAQKAGGIFAKASAKMGNYLWTVEIIPAEIQPPAHTTRGSSGIRIRFGADPVTNAGDQANLIFAFNEMSLLARLEADSLAPEVVLLIDDFWAQQEETQANYRQVVARVVAGGGRVIPVPLTQLLQDADAEQGKNTLALGVLSYLYHRDLSLVEEALRQSFAHKETAVIDANCALLHRGYDWAGGAVDFRVKIPAKPSKHPMLAMNGNQALGIGAIAAGFELCSMYPITPASSASVFLAKEFEAFGGVVHQAEDEIAAIGVALGSNYAGKPALTITSGPGLALKTEFMGLAVMTETPLVLVDVQRGGPSTGLPTKIEQSDLLAALYSTPGDAPKVVLAPTSIEDCFEVMITARRLAEDLRTLVVVLSDANLATGVQTFKRPPADRPDYFRPLEIEPVGTEAVPYQWDPETGIAPRLIPGHHRIPAMTSSLNHDPKGLVSYDGASNQRSHQMRRLKLNRLRESLKTPPLLGASQGDLLVVGWGSTLGAIEEAAAQAQKEGLAVSACHLRFLNPLPPGLKGLFGGFRQVVTVELNYGEPKEPGQLARLLRAETLVDVQSFAKVWGRPLMPCELLAEMRRLIQAQEA